MIETSAVIVNYRTEQLTLECLDHLAALGDETPAELVVVDNSSGRGLGPLLADRAFVGSYLPQATNLGFAGAVNRGLERATRPLLLLLNPDARPEPGCLAGLAAAIDERPQAAAAAPRLTPFVLGGCAHPSATRCDPSWLSTLVEHTALHRVAGRRWLDEHYFLKAEDLSLAPVECAMAQGACLLLRRELVERVGGFDAERFFLYWEETDLERRLRALGFRILYCPQLECRHLGGASFEDGDQNPELFWSGLYAFHRKHNGPLYVGLLRAAVTAGIAIEVAILELLHLVRRGQDPVLRRDLERMTHRLRAQLRVARPQGSRIAT